MKKNKSFYKKSVFWIIIGIGVSVFVLFIILNFTLWTVNEQGQKIFWLSGAGDWIALTIGIIGAVVTAELGYIAVWQNEQQAISSNEYQKKQNELSQLEVAQNEKNEIKKVIEEINIAFAFEPVIKLTTNYEMNDTDVHQIKFGILDKISQTSLKLQFLYGFCMNLEECNNCTNPCRYNQEFSVKLKEEIVKFKEIYFNIQASYLKYVETATEYALTRNNLNLSNKILYNEQELLRNYQACGKEYFTENIEKYTKEVEELTEKYKNLSIKLVQDGKEFTDKQPAFWSASTRLLKTFEEDIYNRFKNIIE